MNRMKDLSRFVLLVILVCKVSDGASPNKTLKIGRGINFVATWAGPRSRAISVDGEMQTYTYSRASPRNFNNGARYYLRYTAKTLTSEKYGYPFYYNDHYVSTYGHRMYRSPSYYTPNFVGRAYFYYSPMFQYYHLTNDRYWFGERPRYFCRNEFAFWPLENQTSEFIDGRFPALNLSEFDVYLVDPPNDDFYYRIRYPVNPTDKELAQFTELNSLAINEKGRDDYLHDFGTSRSFVSSAQTATMPPAGRSSIPIGQSRNILVYNYFACPDGKDPDETECCGPANAQYCCVTNPNPSNTDADSSIIYALSLVPLTAAGIVIYTIVMRCLHVRRVRLARNRQAALGVTMIARSGSVGTAQSNATAISLAYSGYEYQGGTGPAVNPVTGFASFASQPSASGAAGVSQNPSILTGSIPYPSLHGSAYTSVSGYAAMSSGCGQKS